MNSRLKVWKLHKTNVCWKIKSHDQSYKEYTKIIWANVFLTEKKTKKKRKEEPQYYLKHLDNVLLSQERTSKSHK